MQGLAPVSDIDLQIPLSDKTVAPVFIIVLSRMKANSNPLKSSFFCRT